MPREDINLDEFRKRLEDEKARVAAELEQAGAVFNNSELDSGEISTHGDHQADNASDLESREEQGALQDNLRQIMGQITRAFEKLDEGTYGICDVTGKPIPVERLEFEPYAVTTIEGQEQLEGAR